MVKNDRIQDDIVIYDSEMDSEERSIRPCLARKKMQERKIKVW